MNHILSAIRILLVGCLIIVLMPFQAAVLLISPKKFSVIPIYFHTLICRILGIEIETRGRINNTAPTIFMCNHSSYMDIVLLSSLLPASFVAKAEIARWPLFGTLGKLQRTVFINRKRRDARAHLDQVATALLQRRNLVIFPEGTSGDHNRILPFKPTLFRAADTEVDGMPVSVQPVSICFVEINNLPVGRVERNYFAWYGDTGLMPHLWTFLGLGRMKFVIEFFPPVKCSDFNNHKEMAQYCHGLIATAHSRARSGRRFDAVSDAVGVAA